MNEPEEFEFRLRLEREAATPLQVATAPTSRMGDLYRGFTAAPIRAYLGGKQLITGLSPEEQDIRRQNEEAAEKEKLASFAGDVAFWAGPSALTFGAAPGLVKAAGVTGKKLAPLVSAMLAGGTTGATAGLVSPASSDENLASEKAIQVGTGATIGASIPLAAKGVGAAVSGIGRIASPLLDIARRKVGATGFAKGVENIARRGYEKVIGTDKVKAVTDALAQSQSKVSGYRPTAAEAVSHIPEGSPVQALQKMTATTGGGPSAEFGERLMKNKAAIDIAKQTRNVLTAPSREAALQAAGDVPTPRLLANIYDLGDRPGLRTNEVVQKTINEIREKISGAAGAKMKIDAEDLYTIRKEIGNTIMKFSKETSSWDKNLAAGLERDAQKMIDEAIEGAGGTGWKVYLADFAKRSKDIEETVARLVASRKPVQPTSLQKTQNMIAGELPHVALLSRPVVMANAIAKYLGQNVEPEVDALNRQLMLNPQKLGRFLMSNPQLVSRYKPILDALLSQPSALAATTAARSAE